MKKIPFLLVVLSLLSIQTFAQTNKDQLFIGLRFSGNFHHFSQPAYHGLVPHTFSSGQIGISRIHFRPKSAFEYGLSVYHKSANDKGNLPFIMKDFGDTKSSVGISAIALEVKAGPRIGGFMPRIGYSIDYQLQRNNFTQATQANARTNRLSISIPLGVAISLPTNFGSVGIGTYYYVGFSNVLQKPANYQGSNAFDGGRIRRLQVELNMAFRTRKQE